MLMMGHVDVKDLNSIYCKEGLAVVLDCNLRCWESLDDSLVSFGTSNKAGDIVDPINHN